MRSASTILLFLTFGVASLSGASEVAPQTERIRLTAQRVAENLISSVDPVYPPRARRAKLSGVVVLEIVVDRSGEVATARIITGHPLMKEAARDAVTQYRYRPFLLNGEPVEVVSTVGVRFAFDVTG